MEIETIMEIIAALIAVGMLVYAYYGVLRALRIRRQKGNNRPLSKVSISALFEFLRKADR